MDRRKFLSSFSGLSLFLTTSGLGLPEVKSQASDLSTEVLQPAIALTPQIIALETQVQLQQGQFSYYLHNELRHHYGTVNTAQSRLHSDIILAHSFMDSYILHTLNDWHLYHGDAAMGIMVLIHNAQTYANLLHLSAACFIQAADIYHQFGEFGIANALYRQAMSVGQFSLITPPSFDPYRIPRPKSVDDALIVTVCQMKKTRKIPHFVTRKPQSEGFIP